MRKLCHIINPVIKMQKYSLRPLDPIKHQENGWTFGCWSCYDNESEGYSQINPAFFGPELRKSRQTKRSLKNAHLPNSIIVPFQSELTLAKSHTHRHSLGIENATENISNNIPKNLSDRLSQVKESLSNNSSQKKLADLMPTKIVSLRSTNQTTLQVTSKKPKINFIYNHQQSQKQAFQSYSTIPEQPLTPIPALNRDKVSEVKMDLQPIYSQIYTSKIGDQIIENRSISQQSSLTSPLNKLYKTNQKQILVSLELRKQSSKNSAQSSQKNRLKRLLTINEPFSKATMKVRQTVSIREPEDESDLVSIVISNSLLNSFTGLLLPIDELEFETRLSQYKD